MCVTSGQKLTGELIKGLPIQQFLNLPGESRK
jgi:hypothetical protein